MLAVGLALGLAAVAAGCASGGAADPGPAATASAPPGTALSTARTSLGDVVVDGRGMTVYIYTPDRPGSGRSACTGACAAQWPAVHAETATPQVQGVTAEVGTITGTDGMLQVTLDGRPLYTYAGDGAPGDVTGQGLDDVWWAVAPDGVEVTEAPAPLMPGGY
ncbi:hypothetical protein [Xylanimonas ulmi]|uniref:COG4315 family predicted lipoprotein n=1 Tax=Xylanimonas ulmi TaxID=228973 RepID=UPI001F5F6A23|nr:hypothetical protein [Xylanibacterium ulmi]